MAFFSLRYLSAKFFSSRFFSRGSSGPPAPVAAQALRLYAAYQQIRFEAVAVSDSSNRWPSVMKDPGENFPQELSLFALCALAWTPNKPYAIGDYAWPPMVVDEDTGKPIGGPNGYVMHCTRAGMSSWREPNWTSIGRNPVAFADGSVQWTPVVGRQAIAALIGPVVQSTVMVNNDSSPPGIDLTVSAITVIENTVMSFNYIGGTLECDYEVEFAFTIGGNLRIGHQLVQVRQI